MAILLAWAANAQQATFQTGAPLETGSGPLAMAAADFNGDGYTDLAVANTGSGTISVMLSKGDGTFQAPAIYAMPTGCGPNYLAAADFNGDGHPDLMSLCPLGMSVVFFPGNGDGTFAPYKTVTLPHNTFSGDLLVYFPDMPLAIADFNGDGKLDIVLPLTTTVDNAPPQGTWLLEGNGDFTFRISQVAALSGMDAITMTAGDFNGDGKPDLAALVVQQGSNTGNLLIALGAGDGTFRVTNTYPLTTALTIRAADVNGDGITDIVMAGEDINTQNNFYASVSVYLGKGDGSFQAPATNTDTTTQAFLYSSCLADLRGTGKPDLVGVLWTGFTTKSVALATATVMVMQNNGDGTFQSPAPVDPLSATAAFAVACGDFNGDGRADVAFSTTPMSDLATVSFPKATNGVSGLEQVLSALPAGAADVLLNTTPPTTFSDANSASFARGAMAQDSIVAAFGAGLAGTTATAATLGTSLGGVTVNVKDAAGVTRAATLFYVSPRQINYAIPAGTATGEAAITIVNGSQAVTAKQQIAAVEPGLYAANGVAAAIVTYYSGGTLVSYSDAFQVSASGAITPLAIDLGTAGEEVYLQLYGTGIRHAGTVTANIGTMTGLPVVYAGPQGYYVGEDQINVLLPAALKGAGVVQVTLTADGQSSNAVEIAIQ